MASRALQSLLASRHEWTRPHRIIVRIGAVAAWSTAALYLAAGAFTGDERLFIEALGPIFAASLMTTQIILRKEDGGLALFGSGLIVAVWFTMLGNDNTIVPAAVSLVLIAALGMMFVASHRLV
ncbi:MAG: hypothetical protein ACLFVZ_02805, partial [Actinomycetota bacterium]